jgi:hypothetical protein
VTLPASAPLPPVPAPAGGRAADAVIAGKGSKAQKIGLQRQAWARVWLQIVGVASQIAVRVPAAATQGVQGRLCRKPAAVLAARSCARPPGEERAADRARARLQGRWHYAPRERIDREAPYLGGAWRASAVSKDGRPLRLKRWRAAHVAEAFQPSAERPGNNCAVHPPRIALLRGLSMHAPQFSIRNLRIADLRKVFRLEECCF